MDELNISCGEYHQEYVPIKSVIHAFKAAVDLNYVTVLLAGEFIKGKNAKITPENYEDLAGSKITLHTEKSPFISKNIIMSFSSAMDVGRGKGYLSKDDLIYFKDDELPNLCTNMIHTISCHPDGNVTACCGVMTREHPYLTIGNWKKERLIDIVKRMHNDTILNWLHHLGVKDMKEWLKTKDSSSSFPDKHISICELCDQILTNERCIELLNEYGSERNSEIIVKKISHDATIYSDSFNQ